MKLTNSTRRLTRDAGNEALTLCVPSVKLHKGCVWGSMMPALYKVNPRKALEVILWITQRQNPVDFYHVLKVIYFADKYHLNIYGRPVIGDTYDALNHGPVARTVYNLLRGDGLEYQALDEYSPGANDQAAFTVENRYWVRGLREPNKQLLSDSEVEALNSAFGKYAGKSFRELERITHEEPSWVNAVENGHSMRYEDMIDVSEDSGRKAKDIEESARHVVF